MSDCYGTGCDEFPIVRGAAQAVIEAKPEPDMLVFKQALSPPLQDLIEAQAVALIASREPNQVIGRNGSPYMRRFMVARKGQVPIYDDPHKDFGVGGFMAAELENLFIHEFARSDRDEPHCHPWPNATYVVRGWYWEDVYLGGKLLGRFLRQRGDVIIREATAVHAITETSPGCISLFATRPKERDWGFHTAEGFVPWREFTHTKGDLEATSRLTAPKAPDLPLCGV